MAESEGLLTGQEVPADNPETTQESWYSQDYGELVKNKGYKTPDDVLKNVKELEGMVGGRVKMPTPESSAEEVNAFYQKLGKPVGPDAYEIVRPEMPEGMNYDEDMEKGFREVAFEHHASNEQTKAMVDWFNKYEINRYNDFMAEKQRLETEGLEKLRGEWKIDYDENVKISNRACHQLGGDEFIALMEETRLGNNPVMIKTFHDIGVKILSDSLIKGDGSGGEQKDGYVPEYKTSPGMYANDESEEGKKAREYFRQQGYKY